MDRARAEEVMIYAIGFESVYFNGQRMVRSKPDGGLQKLADETGGGYFELKKTSDLAPTFTRVAQELHSQYVIGFSPTQLDNRVHKLTVKIKKAGHDGARRAAATSRRRTDTRSPTNRRAMVPGVFGAGYTSMTVLTEQEFRIKSDEALEGLQRSLMAFSDEEGFEVEMQDGVLELVFEEPSETRFIVSPNAPVRQIWVSAMAKGYKLAWVAGDRRVRARRRAAAAAARTPRPHVSRGFVVRQSGSNAAVKCRRTLGADVIR